MRPTRDTPTDVYCAKDTQLLICKIENTSVLTQDTGSVFTVKFMIYQYSTHQKLVSQLNNKQGPSDDSYSLTLQGSPA